jgi:hypothetical protein
MFVPAAEPLAEVPAEAVDEEPLEVVELLELLHAVTRIAATAMPAAASGTRLSRVNFILLLYGEGWQEWRSPPAGKKRHYLAIYLSVADVMATLAAPAHPSMSELA